MSTVTTDRIEKQMLLHAPRARVWRALTNAEEFGSWFGIKLDGPFTPNAVRRGVIVPTTVDAGKGTTPSRKDRVLGSPGLAVSASVFAALGDETRLRLISRLCDDGPMSIAKLTSGFPITRQGITKHLRVMADAGLVRSIR